MPEGDRLYRYAAQLRAALEGKVLRAARAQGPGALPRVDKIIGATCTGVRAHGKNNIISFDNGLALRVHLRMYGLWFVYPPGAPWQVPERNVRLVLEVDDAVVVNTLAPVVELLEERALADYRPLTYLGPDLLDDEFDAEEAFRRLREPARSGLTIGDAIMDQAAMAGVGNIWKHETLFRCGINPWTPVSALTDDQLRALIAKARELLRASAGEPDAEGRKQRRPEMYVYMRYGQPCRRCGTRIRSAPQGIDIRRTAFCPTCQK